MKQYDLSTESVIAGNKRLPIGVVMPTLDVIKHLPKHVDAMNQWVDLVEEVVIVDSNSTDGTVEYIQKNLQHSNIKFFQRPKGLYQAWNFGISQLASEYCYISTTGDHISRDGLIHLYDSIQNLQCDLVISPPVFVDENHTKIVDVKSWPIHEIVSTYSVDEPMVIGGWLLWLFVRTWGTSGITGSAASNIYKTEVLKSNPYSCEYGSVGDTAWGIENYFQFKFGFTNMRSSFFLIHPSAHSNTTDLQQKLRNLAYDTEKYLINNNKDLKKEYEKYELSKRFNSIERKYLMFCKKGEKGLRSYRKRKRNEFLPWFVRPKGVNYICTKHRFDYLINDIRNELKELLFELSEIGEYPFAMEEKKVLEIIARNWGLYT